MNLDRLLSKGREGGVSPEPRAGSSREIGKKAKHNSDSSGSDIEQTRRKMTRFSSHPIDTSHTPGVPGLHLQAETALQGLEPKGKDKEVARTGSPEESQEQERDDTSLVLDNIQINTVKELNAAINGASKGKGIFKSGHPYHETALSLRRDTTRVIQFREKKKNAPKPEEAYAAMNRLLAEIPRMPTASTKITRFLDEVEQIKQNNPEQAEEG